MSRVLYLCDLQVYLLHNFKSSAQYPMTVYLVAGTQAEDSKPNFIVLMKMADLKRTSENDEDSEL